MKLTCSRDYSQAVDVGTLGRGIKLGTIRVLVWVMGFMANGYATEEFEVPSLIPYSLLYFPLSPSASPTVPFTAMPISRLCRPRLAFEPWHRGTATPWAVNWIQ